MAARLARGVGQQVWIQDAATGKVKKAYRSSLFVQQMAFSRDGNHLAVAGGGQVEVVDAQASTVFFKTNTARSAEITYLGFAPDDRTVVTTDRDGQVIQWRSATARSTWQMPWPLLGATLVRDGRYLITSNATGTLDVFRLGSQPAFRQQKGE